MPDRNPNLGGHAGTHAGGKQVARTAALTGAALVAFASNSILCRMALGTGQADPVAFTALRLASGASSLWLITTMRRVQVHGRPRSAWMSPLMLFSYAACFSFAYVDLSAGTGALVLFGSVQATMLLAALVAGERPHARQWLGLFSALAGLVVLVFPGLRAPSPLGSVLMAGAGASWGVYTLRGRGAANPLADTAANFLWAVAFAVPLVLVGFGSMHVSPRGAMLAILSGALASGLGYVIWYAALRHLTATRAASVQLAVPVLTAAAGVLLLGEQIAPRLLLAAVLILGGVGLAVGTRARR